MMRHGLGPGGPCAPRGGRAGSVAIFVSQSTAPVGVSIIFPEGPAPRVSSEHQTRIFDQFYQVDSSNTTPKGGTRSRACDQPRSRAPTMLAPIRSEGLLTEDEFSTLSQHTAVEIMINAR